MKTTTQKIVISSMFAALVCVTTMIIKVPSPLNGYINLGDGIVLLSGWLLPSGYGLLAAGIGSALADVFSGYMVYAPATFVVKGLMAVMCRGFFVLFSKKMANIPSRVLSGIFAELWMILGYYLFEGVMYGFSPSLVNVPANALQGAVGLLVGVILIKLFEKEKIIKN